MTNTTACSTIAKQVLLRHDNQDYREYFDIIFKKTGIDLSTKDVEWKAIQQKKGYLESYATRVDSIMASALSLLEIMPSYLKVDKEKLDRIHAVTQDIKILSNKNYQTNG